nr:PREDICTED: uncharacterized protein LOC105661879 [Megachile rotundata]
MTTVPLRLVIEAAYLQVTRNILQKYLIYTDEETFSWLQYSRQNGFSNFDGKLKTRSSGSSFSLTKPVIIIRALRSRQSDAPSVSLEADRSSWRKLNQKSSATKWRRENHDETKGTLLTRYMDDYTGDFSPRISKSKE